MTDINVFNADQANDTEPSSVQTQSSIIDNLVGEGKKFKTIEDLAKGKVEADTFIEHLKKEMSELRDELKSKATTEEILKSLKMEQNQPAPSDANQAIAKPEDIANMIRTEISQAEMTRIANENIKQANEVLVTKLGTPEKAIEFLASKSKELGLSVNKLQSMAAESPVALYSLLGLNNSQSKPNDKPVGLSSQVNTSITEPAGQLVKGTKAYYDNMRRTNKAQYFSPAIQNEIMKAAKEGIYKA